MTIAIIHILNQQYFLSIFGIEIIFDYKMIKSEIKKPNTFLYFAYGSNLWSFRILMNNPSAEFVSIARLDNFRLDFIKYSKFWGGPTATLVATANAHVWGVIWRLNSESIADLDEQEGVHKKIYYEKYIEVITPYMDAFVCRVYIQKVNPLPRGDNDKIPVEQWPSWTYKEVMIIGALEHEVPNYYINYLEKIKHNGEVGCFKMFCLLRRFSRDRPCECLIPGRIPRKPLKFDVKKNKRRNIIKHVIPKDRNTN